jgi:hypothetical protein
LEGIVAYIKIIEIVVMVMVMVDDFENRVFGREIAV